MKIYQSIVNSIKLNNAINSKNEKNLNNCQNNYSNNLSTPRLSSNYYLSFKGGNSLNLEQTMLNFQEAEITNGKSIVPERIREATNYVMEAGNPNNLTLIDIHKEVYENILHAETLDEVKQKYPEFKDVYSVNDIDARRDSLIADVKAGRCEIFSPDEDLALQLIKLYWAEAYSLSDLEKYANGKKNMGYIMKKLNIPRFDPHYGLVLKLSDKEYNDRFAETLKLKLAERQEKVTGHVYIPRGNLSIEQKEKISQSLIEYYANNPDRIYLQSIRQREFYKNNPEMAELFKQVLFDAWRLGSSKPVREAMKNHFKKNRTLAPTEKELSNIKQLGAKNRLLMQEFWDKNPQAKKQFSRSLKSAWTRSKKIIEAKSTTIACDNALPAYPKKLADNIKAWAIQKGYDPNTLILNLSLTLNETNQNILNKSMGAKLVSEYFYNNELMSNIYADSLSYALGELKGYLITHKSTSGDAVIRKIENTAKGRTYLHTNELVSLYIDVVQVLLRAGNTDGLAKLVYVLENCYDDIISLRKASGQPIPN